MKLLRFAGIALFALHSSVASALIIDNGDYTTDTELGLDYLDVGLIFDSYTDYSSGVVYDGRTWELATTIQLASSWSDATGLTLTSADILSGDNDMGAAAYNILNSLFDGVATDTGSAGESVIGNYDTSGYYNFIDGGWLGVHGGSWYDSHFTATTSGSSGAWLVSASESEASSVPEPGILALFGLGMLGMGIARKKRA